MSAPSTAPTEASERESTPDRNATDSSAPKSGLSVQEKKQMLKSALSVALASHFQINRKDDLDATQLSKVMTGLQRLMENEFATIKRHGLAPLDEQWPEETVALRSGADEAKTSMRDLAYTHTEKTFNSAIDRTEDVSYGPSLALALAKVKVDSERFGEYDAYRQAAADRQVTISTFEEMLTDDRSLQAEAIATFQRKFGPEATKFTFEVEPIGGPGKGYKVISIGTANFPVSEVESEDDAESKDHAL